jgi:hypothetical protein
LRRRGTRRSRGPRRRWSLSLGARCLTAGGCHAKDQNDRARNRKKVTLHS